VEKETVARIGFSRPRSKDFAKLSGNGEPISGADGIECPLEHERCAFPIVPIKRTATGFRLRKAPRFQLIELNEDPLQVARLCAQQTFQDVAAFRRKHSVYSEIKRARRVAGFTRHPIENRGRDLMMDLAGTDKDRVELVLMLMEKTELRADYVDFRKREERVQAGADEKKSEQRDPGIQETPAKGKIGPAAKRRPQN
jgi:hypothetical protein